MIGFVYFARCVGTDGPIKIGFSARPEMRVKSLSRQVRHPVEMILTIPGDVAVEHRVHGHFVDLHLGNEWFSPTEALTDAIGRLRAGDPIASVVDLSAPGRIREYRRWTPTDRRRHSEAMKASWARKRMGTWSKITAAAAELLPTERSAA